MAATGNYITESDVDNWADAVSQTGTFVDTDVSAANDTIVIDIDVATASLIKFTSDGTLPAPLVYGTAYYAIRVDATTIKVATSAVNAAAGTAVDLTDDGSDSATHTINVGEGSSETDKQNIIDMVENIIEQVTKDFFYAKAFDIYVDGNDKDRLYLGLVPNILSVTEVNLCGVEVDSSYYTNDTDFIYLDPTVNDSAELPELHYRLKRKYSLFPEGQNNIQVVGTYGWSTCPPAIKQAAIILCKDWNDSTLYQHYNDFESERIGGDYSYTKKSKYLTGVVEADRLIKPFIRNNPMMGIV